MHASFIRLHTVEQTALTQGDHPIHAFHERTTLQPWRQSLIRDASLPDSSAAFCSNFLNRRMLDNIIFLQKPPSSLESVGRSATSLL